MENEKTERLNIRISPFEKDVIRMKAETLNLSISEYVVKCAIQRELPKAMDDEEKEIWLTLKKYQTDFSRLSNLVRKRNPALDREIKKIIDELGSSLKKVRNGK